jgi:GNAT superfamily N-acetyltransferase
VTYRVEPLRENHGLQAFRSGIDELDEWLRDHAHTATGQGTRTYVMLADDDRVVGYFAIAPHTIDRDDLSKRTARGAPRHIPAILLAKLALTEDLHDQDLGSELLVVALDTIIEAARRAGGKFVVVDAINGTAASFYVHHEFEPIPDSPHRLVRKLSSIARALDRPWP